MSANELMDRALRLLAARSYSRAEMLRKLGRYASPAEVLEVLTQLENRGYLDDARLSYDRALGKRAAKHWGRVRIAQDLKARGIDAKIIRPVLERVAAEVPETESLQAGIDAYLTRRGEPQDYRELKRLFDYCLRLGYSESLVRQALSSFFSRLEAE